MMGATEMKNESVSAFILLRLRISAARKKLNEQKLNDKNWTTKTVRTKLNQRKLYDNNNNTNNAKSNQIYYKNCDEKHAKLTDWLSVRWRTYQDRNDGPIYTI